MKLPWGSSARRRQLLSPGCLAIRVKWGPVGMRSLRPSLVYLPFSMDSETHWGCTRQAAQVGERKDFWGVGGGYSKFLCWKVEDRQGGFLSRARAEVKNGQIVLSIQEITS